MKTKSAIKAKIKSAVKNAKVAKPLAANTKGTQPKTNCQTVNCESLEAKPRLFPLFEGSKNTMVVFLCASCASSIPQKYEKLPDKNSRGPLFPALDIVHKTAFELLTTSNPTISEVDLITLERRILEWVLGSNFQQRQDPIIGNHDDGAGNYVACDYAMEIPKKMIRAGQTEFFEVSAQRVMKVGRLVLFAEKSLAPVRIARLMIGAEEPAQIRTGMSAELFRVISRYSPVTHNNTLNPGMACWLHLHNEGSEDIEISGAIVGHTLKYR